MSSLHLPFRERYFHPPIQLPVHREFYRQYSFQLMKDYFMNPISKRLLDCLQSVLNAAVRLLCNRRKYDHVTPLLRDVLRWLPVPLRIEFKICLLVYKSLHGYMRDYCKETHSSASGLRLRSTDKCDLLVRRMKTRFGDRAFSAAGPRCWNKLPAALRAADSIDSFKTGLKTYLFSNAYSAVS